MLTSATISVFVLTASKTTTNTAGSYIFLAVIAVVFFVVYRNFMKPRQRAAQLQRETLIALEPGDEVLTGAGIFGTVQHIQGDRVTLWTGTGSTITVLRRTIARKLDDSDADYDSEDEHARHENDSEDDDSWDHEGSASTDGVAPLDGTHGEHASEPEPAPGSTKEDEDR
jgi:preprotein translocase subunit YajC